MAGVDTIPDLAYQKPDGSLFNRLEMEEQMRKAWPKIHWIRIKANKIYGLPRQAAFDMREATLRHWTLDEMIRRGQISGDISGVDAQTYNDDASNRQFIQRLQYLIGSGQAIAPQEGEGVDMNGFVPPPPPMGGPPPNGQPQQQMPFQPPAPQGFAPPQQQMPQGMPQQPPGPPMQMQPPPMMPQQGMPPGGPQFAPPMPGAGMPQMPSTPVPPMPGSPPQAPQQTAPQGGGRRKRGGGDQQQPAPQQAAPVPPMAPQGFAPPQQQFAPPGAPPQQMMPPPGVPASQGFAPQPPMQQAPAPQQVAAAPDPATQQKLDLIIANQNKLSADLAVIQAGLAVFLRATYQRQGDANLRGVLAELNIQVPQ